MKSSLNSTEKKIKQLNHKQKSSICSNGSMDHSCVFCSDNQKSLKPHGMDCYLDYI
jgi:hypothetical protein